MFAPWRPPLDQLLLPRILATLAADAGLAVLTGRLLAAFWLRKEEAPRLQIPAIVLFLALVAQILLLAITFSDAKSLHRVLAALPDVVTMHSVRFADCAILTAFVLAAFTFLRLKPTARLTGAAILLLLCLLFRSATGHAAVDGDFSLAELLQATHLIAMALWCGGVLISGFVIVPQLAPAGTRPYMLSLSTTSTFAVAAVALSGLLKSYRAIGGDMHQLRNNTWSFLLIAKIVCVTAAVALGGWNRLRLRPVAAWDESTHRLTAAILRAEAWVMVAVLVLSAWLSNMPPPGE